MPEIPIPAIVILILTALLGIVYHVFAKIRDEKNNFLRLSEGFRKPFIEAKSILDINIRGLHESCTPREVFIQLYSDQRRNIQAITPNLPRRQRLRLQAAWDNYEKQINDECPSSWFNHNNLYKSGDEIIEKREALALRLNRILFFFDYQNMFSVFRIFERLNS
ncbi:MAG: hypothetical protein HZA20_11770 [Nitrospirae bacterium]|nr:hypothetical protein [Nitrospirota bacterium]